MADNLQQFGLVERIALGTWMLVIGAWTATVAGAEAITHPFLLFNILAFIVVMAGGPILRSSWEWVEPRINSFA